MATNIFFTTKTLFASLLAIGIAASAQAQAPSTRNITGYAPGQPVGNIVGGGTGASLHGGGNDLVIQYNLLGAGGGGAGWGQTGQFARFANTDGDGPQVEYFTPRVAGVGREAWMTGGGDDRETVYS